MVRAEVLAVLVVLVCSAREAHGTAYYCRECHISKVRGLKTADCHRKELVKVPRCHTSGIEVLDLSMNRLREIGPTDLDSYPNVQFLYLSDNFITEIHEDAFSDKYYLSTLDLSANGFYRLPKSIFRVPHLRKLDLAGIGNPAMVEHVEAARPITSPIAHLDLSGNKLSRLPDLGNVPTLVFYNVSANHNVAINVSTFSGLCMLKTFSNEDFEGVFENPCDCYVLNEWLVSRGIEFKNFSCEHEIVCNTTVPRNYVTIYDNCKKAYEEQQFRIFRQQILTNTGIGAAVVVLLLGILFMILQRSRKNKKRKMDEQQADFKRRKYNDKAFE